MYALLWATYDSQRTKTAEYRLYNLKQLAFLIKDNAAAIDAAVAADLGKTHQESVMAEVSAVLSTPR